MAKMKRTISHWTGGGGRANSLDKKHYHFITEFDGRVVQGNETPEDNLVTSDGDYAAHTRNLNTESIGCAMAGMLDATESPLNFGPSPLTRVQFEAHCKHLAEVHIKYGIPVTPTTCITHIEAETTLGVKQNGKWDITVLPFEPSIRGAIPVGNYMRERVLSYMGKEAPEAQYYPTIRMGDRSYFVRDMQGLLKHVGFFPGRIDGIFGGRTRDALISFQAENGLVTNGVCDQECWSALMGLPKREERDVTEADLRKEGSTTIRAADNLQKLAYGGGAMGILGTLQEAATGATEAIGSAESVLEVGTQLVVAYWPLLLAVAVAGGVWYVAREIKATRVRDARTGAHMGR